MSEFSPISPELARFRAQRMVEEHRFAAYRAQVSEDRLKTAHRTRKKLFASAARALHTEGDMETAPTGTDGPGDVFPHTPAVVEQLMATGDSANNMLAAKLSSQDKEYTDVLRNIQDTWTDYHNNLEVARIDVSENLESYVEIARQLAEAEGVPIDLYEPRDK